MYIVPDGIMYYCHENTYIETGKRKFSIFLLYFGLLPEMNISFLLLLFRFIEIYAGITVYHY